MKAKNIDMGIFHFFSVMYSCFYEIQKVVPNEKLQNNNIILFMIYLHVKW